nr:hypothetical protein [Tanacetum cinerariifolium]
MIDQGVTAALAARDALRSMNGDDSHNSRTDDDRKILSSKRDQETRNGTLGFEGKGGLPDMIHGSVVASKPKTMQEAIEIATELMDKKIRTFAERETASKRKFENTSRNTQNQQRQHSNKRQKPVEFIPQHLVKRSNMGDLDPYALNAIITTTVHVLLSATTATKLAILRVTVGIRKIPIMLTIRGALS